MESSDKRATAHIIAERTLATVDEEAPADRPRRWGLRLVAGVLVAGALCAGVLLSRTMWQAGDASGALLGGQAGAVDAAPGGEATLNLNAWPPAAVFIDGRHRAGETPVQGLRLRPGPHAIIFVSLDGALRKEVQVNLAPAQTRTLAVSLDR